MPVDVAGQHRGDTVSGTAIAVLIGLAVIGVATAILGAEVVREILGILAVLGFIALIVFATVAGMTGGEFTDRERDLMVQVSAPAVVAFLISGVLSPYEPKKKRRR